MKTKPTRFFLAAAARLRMLRNELVAWLEVLLVARRNPKRSFEVKSVQRVCRMEWLFEANMSSVQSGRAWAYGWWGSAVARSA